MKNTILDFDKESVDFDSSELGEAYVSDYFSKTTKLSDIISIIDDFDSYTATYRIDNDDKMERISYELYGTTDYWDILVLLNKRDPLFGMPYNFDNISDENTNFINYYINIVFQPTPLSSTNRINALTEEFLNNFEIENEQNRFIKVIKPSKMQEFIRIMKANGYI